MWNNIKQVQEAVKQSGLSVDEILYRRSGKSTSRAFSILERCYDFKNEWHNIVNHHTENGPPTRKMNSYLLDQIRKMTEDLNYSGFEFDSKNCRIRLNFLTKEDVLNEKDT